MPHTFESRWGMTRWLPPHVEITEQDNAKFNTFFFANIEGRVSLHYTQGILKFISEATRILSLTRLGPVSLHIVTLQNSSKLSIQHICRYTDTERHINTSTCASALEALLLAPPEAVLCLSTSAVCHYSQVSTPVHRSQL